MYVANICVCVWPVHRAAKLFGFKEVGDEEDWNLYWTDFSVSLERVMEMKRYQVRQPAQTSQSFFNYGISIRLHFLFLGCTALQYYVCRCGLLLQTGYAWSVCLS